MGTLKNLVEILEKEKWVAFFLLFWAGSFFFWALQSIAANGFEVNVASDLFYVLTDLFNLAAGIVLGLFSLKLLKSDLMGGLSKERMLVFFILLWAGAFFFSGIGDILYYGQYAARYFDDALGVLGGLAELAAGLALGPLGLKLFASKDPSS